ncbi:MAG: hypothetical protein B5M53_04140 [Candidatus Cloacimonas sp. 4484_209]|nr:MAG: hypothetical protein B5M53_04140 [Candidatus Cloacimonas sp. 4484_209]
MNLTFRISILSDYHIGAGYGKGVIDSVILKDKDGLPTIRGTTLTGLLRQGMWELLQLNLLSGHRKCGQSGASGNSYCIDDDRGSLCPVCRILGSPKHPKIWKISSARVEKPSILKSGKILWRNRVNPRIRTAEERKLFSEETLGGKMDFSFTVANESDDKDALEEAAFIVAAFRMIRNIGASRRRGKGQCRFHLINISPDSFKEDGDIENKMLEIFKIKWLENKEINIIEKDEQINQKLEKFSAKKSFNLILLTKEPLLIASRNESGNRFQSIDYIPGYTILGALAWKVANKCDLTEETIYNKFIRLFRRGGIKVSPLYPCLRIYDDIYPTVPSPLDFLTCKLYLGFKENGGHGVKGFAIDKDEPKKCNECLNEGLETPLEPLNKFVPLYPEPKTVDVDKREEMHITIDPKTGRTRTGDLFSYTVIESGQYFMGTIEIENWDDFVNLCGIDDSQGAVSFELRIGKASSRGYGLGQVWLNEADTQITFLGKPIEKRINLTQPITMTLITDTILVDRWGRFYSTLNKEILEQILGVEVEEVFNTYVKTKNIDGFNAHLGLPKWRDCAIAAGTSIGFKIKDVESNNEIIERFKELEERGIGLRRNEGFGRVAFNHPLYDKNKDVSVRINLPEYMRVSRREEKIKNFERRWHNYLTENLKGDTFSQDEWRDEWRAVSRWLRENSKMAIDDITGMFRDFHRPEKIIDMVASKQPHREKKIFLNDESKGKYGQDLLMKVFEELSNKLKNENDTIREYLKTRAIEMLADYIESLREVEE